MHQRSLHFSQQKYLSTTFQQNKKPAKKERNIFDQPKEKSLPLMIFNQSPQPKKEEQNIDETTEQRILDLKQQELEALNDLNQSDSESG